ncbi:39 kDa protein [Buzura suppressaria nucleopolyhedrovirus]|uniref:39 kDa protein n=1 Tax=Buzura suppressaria nuclear polyhedrosis virus TaxID=74320 RepID=W5VKI2_NPVBS|nr:39 kDa protein [Buzura suppressaria nucleopolyhedrovirus]AHH82618.1 39 kDa protein [Buzura suppressaria nucleopolyhedrovirus]AKN90999.1 39K [Buzura suppressaria nucleopolyhedrovirus]QYF10542.1 pp31 [Buzura suppressaria nucleopolyhedrovirus]
MVGHAHQNMIDILTKYENSVYNKTDSDINADKIKLFEKRKIPYRILVVEVHNFDRKVMKRGKKMITNNKYILFNSWYTKNRQNYWLSSHDMWNRMKTNSALCKQFIDIFDYMEKVGKSVKPSLSNETAVINSSNSSDADEFDSVSTNRKKKHDVDAEHIKEGNNQRLRMYEEFYRVLTTAFKSNSAPATSFIYDQKLTRAFVESAIQAFKTELIKLDHEKNSDKQIVNDGDGNITAAKNQKEKTQSRKHKQSGAVSKKQTKFAKRSDEHVMVNDYVEDSQMSD